MKEKFNELNPNAKITIVLVALFLVLAIIILMLSGKKETPTYSASSFSKISSSELKDFDTYLVVENNLNKFLGISSSDAAFSMLDESYINETNVTKENVLEKTGIKDKMLAIKVQKVYKLDIKEVEVYYAEGILYSENEELEYDENNMPLTIENKKYGMLLFIDYDSISFSVYPNISQNDTIKVLNSKTNFNIERNEYNKIMKTNYANKLEICKKYYSDLVFKINYMPEKLYTQLDNADKNNFKDAKEFKEYLDKYYKNYVYSFSSCDAGISSKDYYLNDNENTFKIKIYNLMNYTVDLP